MNRSTLPCTPQLLALSILLAGCTAPKVWVETTEDFDVSAAQVHRLECTTSNGSVEVASAPTGTELFRVHVKKRAGAADEDSARRALAAIHLTKGSASGAFTLGWEWSEAQLPDWASEISFMITMPEDRAARLATSNGAVRVVGLRSQVQVATSNGAIKLEDCTGDWEATTSNGSIQASGTPKSLALKTSNGGIDAKVFTAGPVNGKVRTSNGRIHLLLAEAASTRIRAETNNGSVTADGTWNVLGSELHRLEASRNGGAGMLLLDTSNGSIHID